MQAKAGSKPRRTAYMNSQTGRKDVGGKQEEAEKQNPKEQSEQQNRPLHKIIQQVKSPVSSWESTREDS